jgi:hypothetical protein
MKLLALITALASVAVAGTAGAAEETLVGGEFESGFFGGPYVKYSQVGEGWVAVVGGRGGWIINHTLVLGGSYCGTVPGAYVMDGAVERDIEMEYGGFEIEYIFNSDKLLHYSLGLVIGGGRVNYTPYEGPWVESNFFVARPAANVELNALSFFRISLGLGYRITAGGEIEAITNSDLRGFAPTLTFKFGVF